MNDAEKTKDQLLLELADCQRRLAELEISEAQHKRVSETLQRLAEQLEALRRAGLEISNNSKPGALLNCVVSRAIELLRGTAGVLYLHDPRRDVLVSQVACGPNLEPTGAKLRRGQGLVGEVWEAGEPLIVDDYRRWARLGSAEDECPWTTAVGLPIGSGKQFLGVLCVMSESKTTFSSTDVELLSLLTSLVGLIVENARLSDQARRSTARTRAITEVGRTIASILDFDTLLSQVVDLVAENFGYYFVHVFEVDADARMAIFKAGTGVAGRVMKEQVVSLKIGEEGIVGWVAETGKTFVASDVDKEPRYYFHPALPDTRSELAVPIRLHEKVIGVLDVQSAELGDFDERDVATLETLADQLAVAMENARLYEQERNRSMELSILLDTAQALASSLDLEEVLETIARKAKELTRADGSRIYLPDPEQEILTAFVILEENGEARQATSIPLGQGITGHVAATGVPEIVNRAHRDPRALQMTRTPQRPYSLMCVPLVAKGDVIGVMCLSREGEKEFDPASTGLVTSLANQAATAIENARLHEETKRLAVSDPLTGVWNRRHLSQHLRTEISRADRFGRELSVLVMDIDNLKLFNDTYGHPAGDEVIRMVSQVVLSSSRDIDAIGRYGGDEFAIILPETGPQGAAVVAERILAALQKEPFRPPSGSEIPISISIGAASYPSDTDQADRLFTLADSAMYSAKVAGGGQFSSLTAVSEEAPKKADTPFDILQGLLITVDAKDHYTFKHSKAVGKYAIALATAVGLSTEERKALKVAADLHDVGKIGVRTDILRKPGPLTSEEWSMIYEHPRLGHMLLRQAPQKEMVLEAVLHHHERYDGMGYPDGLEGDEIPLLARILAVADAYSAMITDRPYRKALTVEQGREELLRNAGTQFDPRLAEEFVSLLDRGEVE